MKKKYIYRRAIALLILVTIFLFISVSVYKCAKGHSINKQQPPISHFPEKIDLNHTFRGKLAEVFSDSNCLHVASGIELGVAPVIDEADTAILNKMDTVDSCAFYSVAKLTHSLPYLVPIAKELLDSIGSDFNKVLKAKKMPPFKMVVTSLTRSSKQQKQLSRRNKNASINSAHCFGTTFDISWTKFSKPQGESYIPEVKLKLILASILDQYRDMGRCFIKFEKKQTCFHITVAGKTIDYSKLACDTNTNNRLIEKVEKMKQERIR